MISIMRILVLVSVFSLAQSGYVFAFCEDPPAKLRQMLFSNSLVIHARVVKAETYHDKDDPDGVAGWFYYLQVLKTYRGKAENTVVVKSENASARLLLEPGNEYIVFARSYADGSYEAYGHCGDIQGIDGQPYSKELETQIENLLKSSGPAYIEGEVRDKNFKLTSGAQLKITGKDFSKQIMVDAKGSFSLEVPPGTYKITLPKNLGVTIYSPDGQNPDPSSNEIPSETLVSGQCMQIQLQEIGR